MTRLPFVPRMKHPAESERLECLFDAALRLAAAQASDLDGALSNVLGRTRAAFGCDVAELIFLDPNGDVQRTGARADGLGEPQLTVLEPELAAQLRGAFGGRSGTARAQAITDPWLRDHLSARGAGDGALAMLGGAAEPVGAILVGGRCDRFGEHEVALLTRLAEGVRGSLARERFGQTVSHIRRLQDELRHQAAHDALTGLDNRPSFVTHVSEALSAGSRRAAVIVLDVNGLRTVNDTLGQTAGDELLVAIAGRLSKCIGAHDALARLGNDEFGVLTAGIDSETRAEELARRIDATLEGRFALAGGPLTVQVSIGVAVGAGDQVTGEALIRNADLAMLRAKEAHTRGFERFDSERDVDELRHRALRRRLCDAARRADFGVHYQPIVDLESGSVASREALVRWQDGPRGPVHPAAFIPIAEEMGVIVDIGRQVLRRACIDAQGWLDDGAGAPAVHVNLSPVELHDPEFLDGVDEALRASGLEPRRLVLEITERVLQSDPTAAVTVLAALRDRGVRIALDHFGTGYSSLSHLRLLPLDMLKVGPAFVAELQRTDSGRPLMRMILDLAASLGLQVVAEGIETRPQMRSLRALGCGLGQGFYLGSPSASAGPAFPADEAELRAV